MHTASPAPTRKSVVYLLVQPTISRAGDTPDLKPLAAFGTVVVLVQAGDNPLHRSLATMDNIKKRLAGFDPRLDYLTAAGGGAIASVLVGVALSDMGVDQFTWLSAQRKSVNGHRTNEIERYIPVRVDLGQIDMGLDAPSTTNEGRIE